MNAPCRLLFVLSAFLPLVTLAEKKVEAAPEGTAIGTIFIDLDDVSEEMVGGVVHSADGAQVISRLRALGYEVVSFQGARPKDARYLMKFSTKWKVSPSAGAYIDDFRASLIDGKRVIGTVRYQAATRREGEAQKGRDVIGPLLADLLENVSQAKSVFRVLADDQIRPPDPSAMLPTFDLARAKQVDQAIKFSKFPIPLNDLLGRMGGKDSVLQLEAQTWDSAGRIYGTIEFALTDIRSPKGYFYVLCLVDNKPRKDGTDKVLAAFLMFNWREYRFVYSEKPVFSINPKAKTSD